MDAGMENVAPIPAETPVQRTDEDDNGTGQTQMMGYLRSRRTTKAFYWSVLFEFIAIAVLWSLLSSDEKLGSSLPLILTTLKGVILASLLGFSTFSRPFLYTVIVLPPVAALLYYVLEGFEGHDKVLQHTLYGVLYCFSLFQTFICFAAVRADGEPSDQNEGMIGLEEVTEKKVTFSNQPPTEMVLKEAVSEDLNAQPAVDANENPIIQINDTFVVGVPVTTSPKPGPVKDKQKLKKPIHGSPKHPQIPDILSERSSSDVPDSASPQSNQALQQSEEKKPKKTKRKRPTRPIQGAVKHPPPAPGQEDRNVDYLFEIPADDDYSASNQSEPSDEATDE
eukprot:TRINITY_DN17588_c0_g1_i1.p1 TRINITY_DN17588_c0_g1~~TRINITY_DN17588_c0_g1_i1.p1  ORF type:complete len:370 (+),score=51.50 TRINITY_DN17588_c0_g1_i1:100-1110(+)